MTRFVVSEWIMVTLSLVILSSSTLAIQGGPKVVIRQGALCGVPERSERGNNFMAFLGIPYAQPPVGELRFRDPVPHIGWDGQELIADSFGPICPQWDAISKSVIGSEDCLTLNVFSPQNNLFRHDADDDNPRNSDEDAPVCFANKVQRFFYIISQIPSMYEMEPLPVMFYIHGGAFLRGSARPHGAAKLMNDGSVVLVTVNYRLGVLGFLSTEDHAAAGNYGMLDLVMALHWVRDNIHHFGGDPQRVSIFGESAGAGAVSLLLLSPLAKGLFWTAIAQSGASLCDWTVEENPLEYAMLVSSSLGCNVHDSREMVECLRQRSPADVVAAQQRQLKLGYFPLRAAPVVDRDYRSQPFLPDRPAAILASGNFSRAPLIAGVLEHEGLYFVLQMLMENADQIAHDPHFVEDYILPTAIRYTLDGPFTEQKLNKFKNFYFRDVNFSNLSEVIPPFTDLMSDILFFAGNDRMVKMYSKWAPVYMYVFEHRGNISYSDPMYAAARNVHINSPLMNTAVSHVDELIYLFNMPNIEQFVTPQDQRVQSIMILLWTTFAKYGTPNHPQTVKDLSSSESLWINFRIETMEYFRIGPYCHSAFFFRKYELSVFEYINLTPLGPEAYTAENPHAYYVATWVLVASAALLLVIVVILSVLLARARHKRSYSTSRLNESNNVSVVST